MFVFVFVWVWMGRGWMCDVRRGNNQTSYVYVCTFMLRCVCPVRRLQPRRRAGSRSKRPRMKACAAVGSLSWPLGLSQCGVCAYMYDEHETYGINTWWWRAGGGARTHPMPGKRRGLRRILRQRRLKSRS